MFKDRCADGPKNGCVLEGNLDAPPRHLKEETIMTPKKPKKRNPQDATLRNITVLKKRVRILEDDIAFFTIQLNGLINRIFDEGAKSITKQKGHRS